MVLLKFRFPDQFTRFERELQLPRGMRCITAECTPHFLFRQEKKTGRARSKRKGLLVSNFAPKGQSWMDGRWWLDVPPGPEIFCRVRYTGYGDRSACPHLEAWVLDWGGRRKAFATGPVCSASLHTTWAVELASGGYAGLGTKLGVRARIWGLGYKLGVNIERLSTMSGPV